MAMFLAFVALLVLYFIFSRNANPLPASVASAQVTAKPVFHWNDDGNYDFEVVGESFYQTHIQNLASNHGNGFVEAAYKAILIPDDFNRFDNKAVAVYINGAQVGHLSRDDARSFRRRLAAKKLTGQATSADALIRGGGVHNGHRLSYGVFLDMKPFDN